MNTHDLRRCMPTISKHPSGGRLLFLTCGCDHPIWIGDHVLLPEGGPQGARYRIFASFDGGRSGRSGYVIEFSPRTMSEVQKQEQADALRTRGMSA